MEHLYRLAAGASAFFVAWGMMYALVELGRAWQRGERWARWAGGLLVGLCLLPGIYVLGALVLGAPVP